MARKLGETAVLNRLVDEALASLRKPYPEDVIDEVFLTIQNSTGLRRRYDELLKQEGKLAVNPRIGRIVRERTGRRTGPPNHKPRSILIGYYSRLQ